MIVVRYATLVALVLWLGLLTGARFGDLIRRAEPIGYILGAAVLVGLIVMKLVGPPPHAFFARAGITALMLAFAGASSVAPTAAAAAAWTAINVGLGFILLMWYVRE